MRLTRIESSFHPCKKNLPRLSQELQNVQKLMHIPLAIAILLVELCCGQTTNKQTNKQKAPNVLSTPTGIVGADNSLLSAMSKMERMIVASTCKCHVTNNRTLYFSCPNCRFTIIIFNNNNNNNNNKRAIIYCIIIIIIHYHHHIPSLSSWTT